MHTVIQSNSWLRQCKQNTSECTEKRFANSINSLETIKMDLSLIG